MKLIIVIFAFILNMSPRGSTKTPTSTLPIEQRIMVLKDKLNQQIEEERMKDSSSSKGDIFDLFEKLATTSKRAVLEPKPLFSKLGDVDSDKQLITPIMDPNKNKKDAEKKHQRELKSTETTSIDPLDEINEQNAKDVEVAHVVRSQHENPQPVEHLEMPKVMKPEHEKPIDIFYRRQEVDPVILNTPMSEVHCADLITPVLNGMKDTCRPMAMIPPMDQKFQRFVDLYTTNVTGYSNKEMIDLLYEISLIPIRLFQWEARTLHYFLEKMTQRYLQQFRYMKHALLHKLNKWRLDFRNLSNVLQQTRVFRPYCIQGTITGSTFGPKPPLKSPDKPTTEKYDSDKESDEGPPRFMKKHPAGRQGDPKTGRQGKPQKDEKQKGKGKEQPKEEDEEEQPNEEDEEQPKKDDRK